MPQMLTTQSCVQLGESDLLLRMVMLLLKEVRSRNRKAFPLRMLAMHLQMLRVIESCLTVKRAGRMKTRFKSPYCNLGLLSFSIGMYDLCFLTTDDDLDIMRTANSSSDSASQHLVVFARHISRLLDESFISCISISAWMF